MSKNIRIVIFAFIGLIILIGLFNLSSNKKEINWSETFYYKDKIPFGTYVLFHELPSFLKLNNEIYRIEESLNTYFVEDDEDFETSIFCINNSINFSNEEINTIHNLTNKGSYIFISSYNLNPELLNYLEIGIKNKRTNQEKTFYLESNDSINLNKIYSIRYFDKIPKDAKILGYSKINKKKHPNFIRIPNGSGYIFIHLEPKLFTNYNLLQKKSFFFAKKTLDYFSVSDLIWHDGIYNNSDQESILRFILANKSLKIAWYILIFALIMYLLFKIKREQKAILVVEKEPNLSVDFAKTISSLYYEKGTPENMLNKKIDYFLYHLRIKYLIDTSDLKNPKLFEIISQKTNHSIEELTKIFDEIEVLKNKKNATEKDLIYLHKLIDKLKII